MKKDIEQANEIGRTTCWDCHRAHDLCLCHRLRKFSLEPLLVFLVHPKEFRKTVGTVHLARLSIEGSRCITGKGPDFDSDPALLELLEDPGLFPVVLFPGPLSRNLSQARGQTSAPWLPAGKRLAILVVDGTWGLAAKMVRTSALLRELPRVSFDVRSPSVYRFRKQPKEFCLSTVEAVHLLIETLHGAGLCPLPEGNSHRAMLETFDWMVERQLKWSPVAEALRVR